ncbi:NB-ARC domain-containing protein [Dactylosporangium sp. AC04546]|uniref:NB-ARC domain-containing protein n=1 Tax=Dactylosporangium sp. AC04546 TaxID=2862460 RepID=UPI001EDEA0CE|nr:NB-ARC domain-containing protein [Dactylosporangium sp. AC04546]WVK87596.1 NB-ARC domain-containing protein [Dactylosporangium sp. AC04546]
MDRWLRRYRSGSEGWLVALALAAPAIVAGVVAVVAPRHGFPLLLALAAGYLIGMLVHLSRRSARLPVFVPPSNLPPPPTYIAGRGAEVSKLEAFLSGPSGGPRVANIWGVAGIGKTALAVYTAHRVADRFNGGELFARFVTGTTPEPAASRADAVGTMRRRFIEALSPAASVMPERAETQAALYRRLTRRLSRRNQLLIVLDDVSDVDQVTPLLPQSPWCAVIVTSRGPVEGLAAEPFPLAELAPDDALVMLGAIAGDERVKAEPAAARELVRAAEYHPLAIQLVGMALAQRPNSRLAVAQQLMAEHSDASEQKFDKALDVAYAMLTRGEQYAVVSLGLLDGRVFAPWELGMLLGSTESDAWTYCLRLTDAGLLERRSDDAAGIQSFRLLEHVDRYARRIAADVLDDDERGAARKRLADGRADRRQRRDELGEVFERVQTTMENGAISRAFKDARDAVALAREVSPAGVAEAVVALADLHAELGGLEDVRELLALSPLQGESLARIRALRIEAKLLRRLRQLDPARERLTEALDRCRRLDDRVEHVRLLREFAVIESLGPDPQLGRQYIGEARRRSAGQPRQWAPLAYSESRVLLAIDLPGEAEEVLRVGAEHAERLGQKLWYSWIGYERAQAARKAGRPTDMIAMASEALDGFEEMRHRYGSGHCREIIGWALQAEGDTEAAVRFLTEALETFSNCGDTWVEARAADRLAAAQAGLGQHDEAQNLWRMAERLYRSVGNHPRAERVRAARRAARSQRATVGHSVGNSVGAKGGAGR